MKIAACVILYNPEKSITKNINSYIDYIERIYIIDNTEAKNDFELSIKNNTKAVFIHDGINQGISKRLNQACRLALKEGFDYLLTMDQDSYFDEDAIINYLQCTENFAKNTEVSMFGINYEEQTQKEQCSYSSVKFLITSGSIINLTLYKRIGEFDENLFIDLVDTEYCFRSIQNNYEIIKFSTIFMHHEIGKVTQQRSFKSLKFSSRSIHSNIRLYYMTRNFLYLNKKYENQFREQLQIHKKDLINRIKNKLLYHPDRYKTLQYLFKACNDYRNGKMGKQL